MAHLHPHNYSGHSQRLLIDKSLPMQQPEGSFKEEVRKIGLW